MKIVIIIYLTLMLFQTSISFFLMLNTNEDILENFEEPNSGWSPLTSSSERISMEVNGDHQLFDYQHSSKYLLSCST